MRLGEIKNIIGKVLDDQWEVSINQEPIYGWQAYRVKNFKNLIDALEILSEQSWNDADYDLIKSLFRKPKSSIVQLDSNEYNQLSSYISSLNRNTSLYFSILETMTEEQDPQIINIKIPEESVVSLKDLSSFNNRLEKILKQFAIDGQFEFKWLDKWTSWYEILIIGVFTYRAFIACLKVAQEYLKTKQEYYATKRAELDYKASLVKGDEFTKEGLKTYTEKRLELELEEKTRLALHEIKIKENWKSPLELQNQLIKATTELVKELWNGTEFHLSLNPPEYAEEVAWSIRIDYEKMKEIEIKNNKTIAINPPKKD